MKKSNVRFVYSRRLAEYLCCTNGFFGDLKNIEKNKKEGMEHKKVFVFRDSDELQTAIDNYVKSKQTATI